jgi:hypothetical protein
MEAELGFGFKAKEKLFPICLDGTELLAGDVWAAWSGNDWETDREEKIGLKSSQKPLACVHLYEPVPLLLGNSAKDSILRQEGDRGQFCGKGSAGLRADGMPGAF